MNDLICVHAINATTGLHCCGKDGFWNSADWTKVTCPDCVAELKLKKYFVDMKGASGRYALYMWEKVGMGVIITEVCESFSRVDLKNAAMLLNQASGRR